MLFTELREKYSSKKSGKTVFSKKMGKVDVRIDKTGPREFCVYIDGEKLDTYNTQKEAETTAKEFVKELG